MEEFVKKSDIVELCDRVLENLRLQQEREKDNPTKNLINEVAITSISTLEESLKALRSIEVPEE